MVFETLSSKFLFEKKRTLEEISRTTEPNPKLLI